MLYFLPCCTKYEVLSCHVGRLVIHSVEDQRDVLLRRKMSKQYRSLLVLGTI